MASDEPFSGILPGWVARRALRIRARPLGASPTSLGPTEPVAAPSRRVVQQLAAPIQLDEEWRVAPRRHGREHAGTGTVAATSYHATSVCGGRVLPLELALDFSEEERMMQQSSVSISLSF